MRRVQTQIASCAWLLLALLAVPSSTVFSQTFAPIQANLPIGGPAAWADFDNDGELDFAVQNSSTRLLRNNGNLVFTNILTLAFGGGALAWGDYDNDGQVDLLATGHDSNGRFVSRLLHNEGQRGFSTNQISGIPPLSYGAAAWGDYNNDGRLDLLLAGQSTNAVGPFVTGIYRNNGDGTFSDIHAGLVPVGDGSVAWGDFNNDGYLDILLCGRTNLGSAVVTRVYQNNHDGTFVDIKAGLPGIWLGQAVWGDLNNDGLLDIVMSGRAGDIAEVSRIYTNHGDATFSYFASAVSALGAASIGLGDFNNDGYLDMVLAEKTDSTPVTRLYLNNQGSSFSDAGAGLPGIFFGTVTCLDADNDGRLDVLLSWDGFSRIYRNTISSTNTPPSIPGGLMTTLLPHNHVLLNWTSPAGPGPSLSSGLNYNLRVGTSPGGIDVCSPQSDLSSGMRRIPDRGNAGSTQTWRLANLPKGTYYWSVQSVDQAFHASPFAPESSFVITNDIEAALNHAPVAQPLELSTPEDQPLPVTLIASDADGDLLTWIITSQPTNGVIRGSPPNLVYIPNTNFFGTDGFLWRVYDGLTNSPPVRVAITITSVPDVDEVRLQVFRFPNDPFLGIELTAEPRVRYSIETSPDLTNWTTWQFPFINSLSQALFTDLDPAPTNRFFRARQWP